jgi:hypothetical protein
MLKTETKEIGSLSVSVTQFAGRRNLSVLLDLSKIVGPTIAAAIGSTGNVKDMMNADINVEAIAKTLFASMEKASTEKLIRDLTASTFVNDRVLDDVEFDRVFAGTDLWLLPQVLAFVVEVNFGNFSALVGSVSKASDQGKDQVLAS